MFKVNDVSPPVGADKVVLKDGDRVLWYYATFGPQGGPPTLSVKTSSKKGCYVAQAFDDNGKAATVTGLVFHIGSKRTIKGNRTSTSVPARIRACSSARRRPVRFARTP